jgi:hypothetical protein
MGGPNKDYSLSEARANWRKYLTMYRPADAFLFLRGTEEELLLRKERVCVALEERERGPSNEDEWIEFDQAWPEIEQAREIAERIQLDEISKFETELAEHLSQQQKAIQAEAAMQTIQEFIPSASIMEFKQQMALKAEEQAKAKQQAKLKAKKKKSTTAGDKTTEQKGTSDDAKSETKKKKKKNSSKEKDGVSEEPTACKTKTPNKTPKK